LGWQAQKRKIQKKEIMIRVIFFATPKIALKSLDYLIKSDKIEVLAVVTQADKPAVRGHKILPPPVKEYALEHNIPVFQEISCRAWNPV